MKTKNYEATVDFAKVVKDFTNISTEANDFTVEALSLEDAEYKLRDAIGDFFADNIRQIATDYMSPVTEVKEL